MTTSSTAPQVEQFGVEVIETAMSECTCESLALPHAVCAELAGPTDTA